MLFCNSKFRSYDTSTIIDIIILSFSISVKNEKPPDHCSVRWLPVYLKTALMPS